MAVCYHINSKEGIYMNLDEMNQLIGRLSESRDNYSLCLRLEEISKSKNFKEGKISRLLVDSIISFSNDKYFFETISIIIKILNSKYYSIGVLKENDIIDILYMNKGQGEVIHFKFVSMVLRKISSIKPENNIKKFLLAFLNLDLEKNDFVLKVKINRMIEENRLFKSVLSSIIGLLLCDDFYNGIINDDEFESLLRLKNTDLDYISFEFSLSRIVSIFESGIYGRGLITKEQMGEIINCLDKFCTIDGFLALLISDIYKKGMIKYEDIRFMLEEKYVFFKHIMINILGYTEFSFEEKECYILALLKMGKKDELCNLYNRDIESDMLDDSSFKWECAVNFVRNVLPSLALGQTEQKIRARKLEEFVDNSQES